MTSMGRCDMAIAVNRDDLLRDRRMTLGLAAIPAQLCRPEAVARDQPVQDDDDPDEKFRNSSARPTVSVRMSKRE